MFSAKTPLHPVHISVCNIEYDNNKKRFDISVKLFADDFAKVLEKNVNFNNKSKTTEKIIDDYLKRNLILKFDNELKTSLLKFNYYTYTEKENSIKLFYTYKLREIPLRVTIMNTLLNDLYRDQKNLLIFSCKNTEKAIKFDRKLNDISFLIK